MGAFNNPIHEARRISSEKQYIETFAASQAADRPSIGQKRQPGMRPAHHDRLEHPLRNRRSHAGHRPRRHRSHAPAGANAGPRSGDQRRPRPVENPFAQPRLGPRVEHCYNLLAGGTCLEHLELLRSDEAYLDALGARRVPDPTTAGDYCRRFDPAAIFRLQAIFNSIRLKVCGNSPSVLRRGDPGGRRHDGRDHRRVQRGHGPSTTKANGAIIR